MMAYARRYYVFVLRRASRRCLKPWRTLSKFAPRTDLSSCFFNQFRGSAVLDPCLDSWLWQTRKRWASRPAATVPIRGSAIGGSAVRRTRRTPADSGLIASLDDQASHWVLQTAISSLNRLTHRGAIAADGKTGDGCGLLIKMPDALFLRAARRRGGIFLTPPFAAGLVFLDPDPRQGRARPADARPNRSSARSSPSPAFDRLPTDPSACGAEALKTLPTIVQIFVNASGDIDEAAFNRRLYMARRRAEKLLEASDPKFYMPSLSASTIVYKGMVMPQFLAQFYPDLQDPRMEASVVVFHQRFSTNTLPQWRLAHPYRYLAHNGEINTVQGNRSWAVARGPLFRSPVLPDLSDVLPVVSLTGSDSQSLDNMLELLLVGGLDPMHALRILVPPAWQSVDMIDPDLKAFYEYYATHMEPWDGPAGIVVTDGRYACVTLDRNGLRPARWVITKNRHITVASEAGGVGLRTRGRGAQGEARTGRNSRTRPADLRADGHQTGGRSPEEPPSLQGVAEEGRALPADRSDRSAPRGRALRSRHAGDVPEDVQRVGRGARRDHPRSRGG